MKLLKEKKFPHMLNDEVEKQVDVLHAVNVLKTLNSLRNNGKFLDFDIFVDNVTFPVHKFILIACSKFFQHLVETRPHLDSFTLSTTPDAFRALLDYFYEGKIEFNPEIICDLLPLAKYLSVSEVVRICENFPMNENSLIISYSEKTCEEMPASKKRKVELNGNIKNKPSLTKISLFDQSENDSGTESGEWSSDSLDNSINLKMYIDDVKLVVNESSYFEEDYLPETGKLKNPMVLVRKLNISDTTVKVENVFNLMNGHCKIFNYSNSSQLKLKGHKFNEENQNNVICHKENKKYVCMECGKVLDSAKQLQMHRAASQHWIQCGKCDFSTPKTESLILHAKKLHNILILECSKCSFLTSDHFVLLEHDCINATFTETAYECQICCRLYCNFKKLRYHIYFHFSANGFSCPFCEYINAEASEVRRHVNFRHNEKPCLKCLYCTFVTNIVYLLELHIQESHAQEFGVGSKFALDLWRNSLDSKAQIIENELNKNKKSQNKVDDMSNENIVYSSDDSQQCKTVNNEDSNKNYSCIKMNNTRFLKENRQKILRKGLFNFCLSCNVQEIDEQKLRSHIINEHRGFGVYQAIRKNSKKNTTETNELDKRKKNPICLTCNSKFPTYKELDNHIFEENHRLQCSECQTKFRTSLLLYFHQKVCHDIPIPNYVNIVSYKCPHCCYEFYLKDNVENHLRSCHSLDIQFFCNICQKIFKSWTAHKEHKFTHLVQERKYTCSHCDYKTMRLYFLHKHIEKCQKRKEQIQCSLCNFIAKHPNDMTLHTQQFHPSNNNDDNHTEQFIDNHTEQFIDNHTEQFIDLAAIEKKLAEMGENYYFEKQFRINFDSVVLLENCPPEIHQDNFFCLLCSYFASVENRIRNHVTKVHNGIGSFVHCEGFTFTEDIMQEMGDCIFFCSLCSFVTDEFIYLRLHIHSDHKNSAVCRFLPKTPISFQHRDDNLCNKCTEIFPNQLSLATHRRNINHPLMCNKCDFLTNVKDILYCHLHYRHLIPLPNYLKYVVYRCPYCPYVSTQKHITEKHLKEIHEKELSSSFHICLLCSRHFSSQKKLNWHVTEHMKGKITYMCGSCNEVKNKYGVQQHLAHTQSKEKSSQTYNCFYKTGTDKDLVKHMKLHNITDENLSSKLTPCQPEDKLSDNNQARENLESEVEIQLSEITVASENIAEDNIDTFNDPVFFFICLACGLYSQEKTDIKTHIIKTHDGKEAYAMTKKINQTEMSISIRECVLMCSACNECFNSDLEMKQHILAIHKGLALYKTCSPPNYIDHVDKFLNNQCNTCGALFLQDSNFFNHLNQFNHFQKCNQCSYSTTSEKLLHFHKCFYHGVILPEYLEYKVYRCPHCCFVSDCRNYAEKHLSSHSNCTNYCLICTRLFSTTYKLNSHFSDHLPDEKWFLCPHCDLKSTNKMQTLNHIRCIHYLSSNHKYPHSSATKQHITIHEKFQENHISNIKTITYSDTILSNGIEKTCERSEEGSFVCSSCSVCETSLTSLVEHIKENHEGVAACESFPSNIESSHFNKPQEYKYRWMHKKRKNRPCKKCICPVCKKQFATTNILKAHMACKKHSDRCDICSFTTYNSDHLIFHKFKKHKVPLPESTRPKTFRCPYCQLKGNKKAEIEHHIKLYHIQQRLNFCKYCRKSFSTHSYLKIHQTKCNYDSAGLRKKTGNILKLKCYFCQHLFSDKKNLSHHMQQMHEKLIKVCPFCPEHFPLKDQLQIHMEEIHEIHINSSDTVNINFSNNSQTIDSTSALTLENNLPTVIQTGIAMDNILKSDSIIQPCYSDEIQYIDLSAVEEVIIQSDETGSDETQMTLLLLSQD